MSTSESTSGSAPKGGPGQDALERLLVDRRMGALTTLKRDGRPQLSMVLHHYDPAARELHVSATDGRAKTRNLRRDPRASYLVSTPAGWAYAVAECHASLSPVATAPDDATCESLVDLYRATVGEHEDWAAFRAAMVEERRLLVRLHVERLYGRAGG